MNLKYTLIAGFTCLLLSSCTGIQKPVAANYRACFWGKDAKLESASEKWIKKYFTGSCRGAFTYGVCSSLQAPFFMKNCLFAEPQRCVWKFYPRHINYMPAVKFPDAPWSWTKLSGSRYKLGHEKNTCFDVVTWLGCFERRFSEFGRNNYPQNVCPVLK